MDRSTTETTAGNTIVPTTVLQQMTNKEKHIPQGYKDSPLGIIPKEWEVKRLGDLCIDIYSGKNKVRVESGTYPVYGSTGIIGKTDEYKYDGDRILVARVGAHAGQVSSASGKYDVSDNTIIVENKEHYSQYFAYQQLIAANLNKLVFGSGQPLITAGMLKRMYVICPPPVEQEKINAVLKLWDTAIEKQSKLIEKLKLRKRALMQQLLTGKKRLPGFSGKWIHVPIKTFAKEVSNRNVGGANHIVLSCTKYDGLVPSLEYFGKQIYSNDLSSYKIIPQGHFAYATNHIEEGSIGYQSNYENGLISPMYTVFVTNKGKVNDTFLYAVLKSHHLIYLYKSMMEGSINRRGGLRWDPFSTIKIDLPSLEEQNAIASVLIKADKEIKLANEKLANLQYQKRGLMQQLLTGKKQINL